MDLREQLVVPAKSTDGGSCGEASPMTRDLRGMRMPLMVLVSSALALVPGLLGAGEGYAIGSGALALVALIAGAIRFTNAPLHKGRPTPVTLDREAIRYGTRQLSRAKLVKGLAQPAEDGALLQLRTSRWREPVVLHFAEPTQAHALLSRLGLDAEGRTAHFVAQSAWFAKRWFVPLVVLGSLALIVLMVMAVAAGGPRPAVLAVIAAWAVLTLSAAVPVVFSVGLDGIGVRRLGKAEFIPWSDVVRVTPFRTKSVVMEAGGIEIEVRGREAPLRLPMATDRMAADTPERLAARIDQARAAAVSRGAPLALKGSQAERVNAAKAVLAGAAGYRAPHLEPEAVSALVLDPRAESADRLAAAAALVESESGRAHVRVAANTTAERSLQLALNEALAEAELADEAAQADTRSRAKS